MKKYILPSAALPLLLLLLFAVLPNGFFRQEADPDAIAAKSGEAILTNRMLGYYYWNTYYNTLESYAEGAEPFDPHTLLSEQDYGSGQSWQDHFIGLAADEWQKTMAVCAAAEAAGFSMPENYQNALDTLEYDLQQAASDLGLDGVETAEDYLQYNFGEAAGLESYREYIRCSYLAAAYAAKVYDGLYAQHSLPLEDGTIDESAALEQYESWLHSLITDALVIDYDAAAVFYRPSVGGSG